MLQSNYQYAFDKGLNLIRKNSTPFQANSQMIVDSVSNRAISKQLYDSLALSPEQKANLGRALVKKGIFDIHGNQLITKIGQNLAWDYRNQLQTTVTQGSDGQTSKAYSVYAKTGLRNHQITEKTNAGNNTIEITETVYLGNLEYRTTWLGTNLSYDGEAVIEKNTGNGVNPYEQYSNLRLRQGHKQVAQKRTYTYKEGIKVFAQATSYTLDNNIDSCELTLNGQDRLESFESYKPYGVSAISYGRVAAQPYKYSGQERDESGLYYYGFRSLDPETYRWVSPDPAGIQGSELNWYAMTGGNPVSFRDKFGLMGNRIMLLISGYLREQFDALVVPDIQHLIISFYRVIVHFGLTSDVSSITKYLHEKAIEVVPASSRSRFNKMGYRSVNILSKGGMMAEYAWDDYRGSGKKIGHPGLYPSIYTNDLKNEWINFYEKFNLKMRYKPGTTKLILYPNDYLEIAFTSKKVASIFDSMKLGKDESSMNKMVNTAKKYVSRIEGGRFSKASLVFAAIKNFEIHFELEGLEDFEKIFHYDQSDKNSRYSGTTASELRFVKRFWDADKSRIKKYEFGLDGKVQGKFNPRKRIKLENHKKVFDYVPGGFKNYVKFFKKGKLTSPPWKSQDSKN